MPPPRVKPRPNLGNNRAATKAPAMPTRMSYAVDADIWLRAVLPIRCHISQCWLLLHGHGLKFVALFRWPGAIHEGKGEAAVVVDERATEVQREALLRIICGQDTKPGATIFNVFASTLEKLHDPIFAPIDFQVDVAGRKARLVVPGVTEGHGEPILNPVTGAPHRVPRPGGWLRIHARRNRTRLD